MVLTGLIGIGKLALETVLALLHLLAIVIPRTVSTSSITEMEGGKLEIAQVIMYKSMYA